MVELKDVQNQLANDRVIIEKLMCDLDQEKAAWKPDPDRWSMLEIINHIIDIEIEDFRYDCNLILFEPEKDWPSFDEREWVTSRKYNERNLEGSIRNFIQERDTSLQWLAELQEQDLFLKHGRNGSNTKEMHAGDVLASWIGHDLFHIKHMTLLKWDILKKWSEPFSPEYSGYYP